ncbi:MAG: hypothetical protein K0U59_12100 [Gammaproteobacteria bacterium]|nr:hypothetical protein [Gammaproteobacteria bacterium]
MKKNISFLVVVLLVVAGYLVWNTNQADVQGLTAVSKEPKVAVDTVPHITNSVELTETKQNTTPSVKETAKDLWKESKLAQQVLEESDYLPADLNAAKYLELDVNRLKNMALGDYLKLSMPGVSGNYDAQVSKIEQHSSGNRTVQMNFPGLAQVYNASFTLGVDTVYGHLTLPTGSYTLEAQGSYAWVASKADLARNHEEKHDQSLSADAPLKEPENNDLISIEGF